MSKTAKTIIREIQEIEIDRNMFAVRIARQIGRGAKPGEWDLLRFEVLDTQIADLRAELARIEPEWLAA